MTTGRIVAPAYQAAGAAERFLDEAGLASAGLEREAKRILASRSALQGILKDLSPEATAEIAAALARQADAVHERLTRHALVVGRVEDLLEEASALADDHRNTVEIDPAVGELVMAYFDDALDAFVDTVLAIGGDEIRAQGLTRAMVRQSAPHFQAKAPKLPDVLVRLGCGF